MDLYRPGPYLLQTLTDAVFFTAGSPRPHASRTAPRGRGDQSAAHSSPRAGREKKPATRCRSRVMASEMVLFNAVHHEKELWHMASGRIFVWFWYYHKLLHKLYNGLGTMNQSLRDSYVVVQCFGIALRTIQNSFLSVKYDWVGPERRLELVWKACRNHPTMFHQENVSNSIQSAGNPATHPVTDRTRGPRHAKVAKS